MYTSVQPYQVHHAVTFSHDMLLVTLHDGRMIATPLAWYLSLSNATPEQPANYELGLSGIHWPELDEDLSIAGMLRGVHPPQHSGHSV